MVLGASFDSVTLRPSMTAGLASTPHSPAFRADRLAVLADIERRHFWFSGRAAFVRSVLPDSLVQGHDVLDVGCGTGSNLVDLHRRGARVAGVDQLRESLVTAGGRCPAARVLEGRADDLPFADGTFDGVTLLDVLEHVDERSALADIRRVLRPRGWLLVTVPAGQWLWSYRDEDSGHLRRYSRRRLEGALTESGFAIERFARYQCALFPMVVVTRFLGRSSSAWRDREERVPGALNSLLAAVNRTEARLAARITLPWGSSLAALARARP